MYVINFLPISINFPLFSLIQDLPRGKATTGKKGAQKATSGNKEPGKATTGNREPRKATTGNTEPRKAATEIKEPRQSPIVIDYGHESAKQPPETYSMGSMPRAPEAYFVGSMPQAPEGYSMGSMPRAPEAYSVGSMPQPPEAYSVGSVPRPPDAYSVGSMPQPQWGNFSLMGPTIGESSYQPQDPWTRSLPDATNAQQLEPTPPIQPLMSSNIRPLMGKFSKPHDPKLTSPIEPMVGKESEQSQGSQKTWKDPVERQKELALLKKALKEKMDELLKDILREASTVSSRGPFPMPIQKAAADLNQGRSVNFFV